MCHQHFLLSDSLPPEIKNSTCEINQQISLHQTTSLFLRVLFYWKGRCQLIGRLQSFMSSWVSIWQLIQTAYKKCCQKWDSFVVLQERIGAMAGYNMTSNSGLEGRQTQQGHGEWKMTPGPSNYNAKLVSGNAVWGDAKGWRDCCLFGNGSRCHLAGTLLPQGAWCWRRWRTVCKSLLTTLSQDTHQTTWYSIRVPMTSADSTPISGVGNVRHVSSIFRWGTLTPRVVWSDMLPWRTWRINEHQIGVENSHKKNVGPGIGFCWKEGQL